MGRQANSSLCSKVSELAMDEDRKRDEGRGVRGEARCRRVVFWGRTISQWAIRRSSKPMSNKYGISEQDEREIRARDRACVYCRISMKQKPHAMSASGATIEHFNNDGPLKKKYNLGICCRRCNSSKGTMSLSAWFKTSYCRERKISEETVSRPVKKFMRSKRRS